VLYSFQYWNTPRKPERILFKPMAELHGVNQRLQAALGRLDSAVESRLELAANQQQVEDLTRKLEAASAENAELHQTTDTVARRLDDAIDRIRQILGE
jgi:ABC-type transporter Mla subunit MlaD